MKTSPIERTLNIWAVILIVWSIYRANLRLPEWFDEFIAKPMIFVLPIYYYITKKEKNNFFAEMNWKLKFNKNDYLLGIGLGAIFFVAASLGNLVKSGKIVFFPHQQITFLSVTLIILTAFATSFSEEILSRGFVLKRLYEESKNIYTSSFFSSLLFFFLHIPILFTNIKITGNLLLYFMATDIILSLANSFIYLDKKNLMLPIMIHAFYNLSIYFFV